MNGDERRRMEVLHPENFSTTEERKEKQEIVTGITGICNGVCVLFMMLGALIVAYTSTRYMGVAGFYIAFLGTMSDVILGALLAYYLGKKMQIYYTENYLNYKVVS